MDPEEDEVLDGKDVECPTAAAPDTDPSIESTGKKFAALSIETDLIVPFQLPSPDGDATDDAATNGIPRGVDFEAARRQAILQLHKFNIVKKIDDGSYGEVFEAQDVHNGERVAIKRIGMSGQHTIPQDVIREIATLTRLASHPLVVDLKKVFVYDNDIHLVLSFHETTLHDEAEELDLDGVRNYGFQLLVVVDHLWREGILHRDIKPENILVGRHGIIKLTDFGHSNCHQRMSSDHVGTRDYRAPELMFGCDDYDVRSEVWSVACTIYFLYTGKHLFDSKNELELLGIWLQNFEFPTPKQWPALVTYRKYEKFSIPLRRAAYHRGINVISKLLANKDKAATWSDDQDLRNFAALLSCMLAPNPAKRPMPASLLEHDFFGPVWRSFVDPDISKQLHLMRHAMQWNPRACMDTTNVKGMSFYSEGDAAREVHFEPLREAFRRIVAVAEDKYPLSLQVLLDGLDVLDHLVADNGWNIDRLLVHHKEANAGYLAIMFACVFIVFKYYEDQYHDLALDTDGTTTERSATEVGSLPDSIKASSFNAERDADCASLPPAVLRETTDHSEFRDECPNTSVCAEDGVDALSPSHESLAVQSDSHSYISKSPVASPLRFAEGPDYGSECESWETGSTLTSTTSETDSSDRGYQRRIDDVSDTLEIRLKDVLACERVILETIGLEFLNRPTLHRQLMFALNQNNGDRLEAAQYLGLLALQDMDLTAKGLQHVAQTVISVLDEHPSDDASAILPNLLKAEALPYSLISPSALDLLTGALHINLAERPSTPTPDENVAPEEVDDIA